MAESGISKIEFINTGFKEILQSTGTQEVVQQVTDSILNKAVANYAAVSPSVVDASAGFAASVINGGRAQRWMGFVSTTDKNSAAAESEDKVLTRAIT